MAHITEIKIDNLLGRSDPVHLKLDRHVNIFFGENGCGKTTLLRILDAALSRDGSTMNRLAVDRAEVSIFSINQNRVIKHIWERKRSRPKIQLAVEGNEWESLSDVDKTVLAMGAADTAWKLIPSVDKELSTRWAHSFLPTTRLYFDDDPRTLPRHARVQLSDKQLDDLFAESVNRQWLLYYSRTLTEVRRIQEEGLRSVLKHVLLPKSSAASRQTVPPREVYERVSRFLARQSEDSFGLGTLSKFEKSYVKDVNLARVVDNLYEIEIQIEKAMLPVDRFQKAVEQFFSRGKQFNVLDRELQVTIESGKSIPLASLSSGEKHLIKILLASMTAKQNSILIDEPELSMHIDWQRNLVETIRTLNPECQIILASHSPEVMADIPDQNIFKL